MFFLNLCLVQFSCWVMSDSLWPHGSCTSLSINNSRSLLKFMSIKPVMPSNHLMLCHPHLLQPSIFHSIRVFSNDSALHIRWPKDWSYRFNVILPMNIQDLFPLGLTGWISLLSKGLLRVSSTPQFSSVQFSCSAVSDSLRLHVLKHARPPCPYQLLEFTQTHVHRVDDAIQPSVIPFPSCLPSFPASGSFPISEFFTSGGQSIGVSASASVLPVSIQDWFPLWWTGWISLQSNGLSRVFSNTSAQNHKFFGAPLSL